MKAISSQQPTQTLRQRKWTNLLIMAIVVPALSAFLLPAISPGANGQPPRAQNQQDEDGPAKGKRRGGKGKGKGEAGEGERRMDPTQLAARLIEEHDSNGDGALDQTELVAALQAMMQRRMQGGQGMRRGQGGGGPDGAPEGGGPGGKKKKGKGKRGGDGSDNPPE